MQVSIIPEPKKILVYEEGGGAAAIKERVLDPSMQEEEYRLRISPDGIWIEGGSEKALLYAGTTLEQLQLQYENSFHV